MTRPNIVRADTLDLQDHDQPSAQVHRHPPHSGPNGAIAAHQTAELRHAQNERHAEQDYIADQWGSGRSSHEGSELLEEDPEFLLDSGPDPHDPRLDQAAVQQNGGHVSAVEQAEAEMTDQEGDDDMDDDAVDKISSSPSIEDGQSTCARPPAQIPPAFPPRFRIRYAKASRPLSRRRSAMFAHRPIERRHLRDVEDENSGRLLSPGAKHRKLQNELVPPSPPIKSLPIIDAFADSSQVPWRSLSDMSLGGGLDRDEDATLRSGDIVLSDLEEDRCFILPSNPQILDHGWASLCLQDTEDIDFEFVYALHTFVATVEGQANATKGDTMVLLDDSNSYWWLVRVVKDSSIGYLPAEHIETPTERLARLNKHRNIDLAQSMLGDNPERSKNPLKKAMRRRNAKMVQFSTNTYFEPSEVDWSDEEEGEGEENVVENDEQGDDEGQHDQQEPEQAEAKAETVTHEQEAAQAEQMERSDAQGETTAVDSTPKIELEPATDDPTETNESARNARSRNGTIRNTDSFFKDETAEPRKITLTPGLLREESGGTARTSESADRSPSASLLEELEPVPSAETIKSDKGKDSKSKKDKKAEKEKKSGMLSGLFKRKDKKIKVDEAAGGTVSKQEDVPLSPGAPTPSDSNTAVSPTSPTAPAPLAVKGVRGGKLTKTPPVASQPAPSAPQDAASPSSLQAKAKDLTLQIPDDEVKREKGVRSPLANILSPSSSDQPKKEKLKKAKTRMELDVDSSPENELADDVAAQTQSTRQLGAVNFTTPARPAPAAPNRPSPQAQYAAHSEQQQYAAPQQTAHDLSRSADPAHQHHVNTFQPGHAEESSQSTIPYSDSVHTQDLSTAATTPADNDRRSSWDPVALRQYLDQRGTEDLKDMLYIIQDHTETKPAGMDHPIMQPFVEYQKTLDKLSNQLDTLMLTFLEKEGMVAPRPYNEKPEVAGR